jgi:hypothetical protein
VKWSCAWSKKRRAGQSRHHWPRENAKVKALDFKVPAMLLRHAEGVCERCRLGAKQKKVENKNEKGVEARWSESNNQCPTSYPGIVGVQRSLDAV